MFLGHKYFSTEKFSDHVSLAFARSDPAMFQVFTLQPFTIILSCMKFAPSFLRRGYTRNNSRPAQLIQRDGLPSVYGHIDICLKYGILHTVTKEM